MSLPTGFQDFTKLRENNLIYVDKTMFFEPFLFGGQFFVARPRRFGKSLFLSTVKAIFQGRKDLFKGLWLENNHDFKPHPVIRLDFSQINFVDKPLGLGVLDWLRVNALEYNYEIKSDNGRDAFVELIRELSKIEKVVVLIDEYDKPITDYLLEPEARSVQQKALKNLYGALKSLDSHLHLVLMTGVSKIGKLSLFSDLNNLRDISLEPEFATLFGYTKAEIKIAFPDYLNTISQNLNIALPELWESMQRWYNGYSWDAIEKVYCPFSFLLFLVQKEFKSYWYETGTPTFLLEIVRNAKFNPLHFESVLLDELTISTTNIENLEASSLMFQTGYLTLKNKQISILGTRYELTYPNEEVRMAFSKGLLLEYSKGSVAFIGSFSLELQDALLLLDWTKFFDVANRVFAGIPYEIFPKRESYVHSLMHLMLISTGFQTQSQVQTSQGRMDTLTTTFEYNLIFEFKVSGTASQALEQIDENRYADGLKKPIIKVGVLFDLEQKQISDWAISTTPLLLTRPH